MQTKRRMENEEKTRNWKIYTNEDKVTNEGAQRDLTLAAQGKMEN